MSSILYHVIVSVAELSAVLRQTVRALWGERESEFLKSESEMRGERHEEGWKYSVSASASVRELAAPPPGMLLADEAERNVLRTRAWAVFGRLVENNRWARRQEGVVFWWLSTPYSLDRSKAQRVYFMKAGHLKNSLQTWFDCAVHYPKKKTVYCITILYFCFNNPKRTSWQSWLFKVNVDVINIAYKKSIITVSATGCSQCHAHSNAGKQCQLNCNSRQQAHTVTSWTYSSWSSLLSELSGGWGSRHQFTVA